MSDESGKQKLTAKFEKSTVDIVKGFCKARGESYSSFIRMAVKKELARYSYFTDEEKKALGVKPDESQKED